ncbi:universal stress protein [Agrobacterium rubi]|uniref:universal stress protein n=1 Tax=Agrobacterium rubi TaxID=28099 RepID=UPI001571B45E|nr:universal stress protein [Agrobacterium rubi]NTF10731.1 universal stress protein [Agrobacterium rubi]NTF23145.1 universal stress protein [Agrobacterium rubi]
MTKIIAFIDGSQYAKNICDHIVWINQRAPVSVDLIHVIGRRDTSSAPFNLSGNIGLGARTALLEELADLDARKAKAAHQRGHLLLDEAKALLKSAGIPDVETKLRNGDLADAAVELEASADLIVIGKRGEGADFAKGHLGSNLERVVRSTHKTVVIVSSAFAPVRKVLIAFDGGATALRAIDQVARNPILSGIPCKLVMAADDTSDNRQKVADGKSALVNAGFSVEAQIIKGETQEVISEVIEREGYDLLIMGAFSHSRLRSLFLGSSTTEMIRSCTVPVVIIR